MKYFQYIVFTLFVLIGLVGCSGDDNTATTDTTTPEVTTPKPEPKPVTVPAFNRDSAYAFVSAQVELGPREPGSEAIETCRDWMADKLESYGAVVTRQAFDAAFYYGETHASENIIGAFNPDHPRRVILAAHYDTRFMAEEDSDPARQDDPIDGADDGASGVGVLMEIARLISENPIDLGIDIILFDAEDQGQRGNAQGSIETWCKGSQYWSRRPHVNGYKAEYGILLDMVGASDAFFNRENVNGVVRHAGEVHDLYKRVWSLAKSMGKGRYFQDRTIAGIIDDHYFVNTIAGIPMIDIINKPPTAEQGFGPHWHTHSDNIDIIDKNTLAAVGQVVTAVIYRESGYRF